MGKFGISQPGTILTLARASRTNRINKILQFFQNGLVSACCPHATLAAQLFLRALPRAPMDPATIQVFFPGTSGAPRALNNVVCISSDLLVLLSYYLFDTVNPHYWQILHL